MAELPDANVPAALPVPPPAPAAAAILPPGIPADHGLSGLALIMQLAGAVFGAFSGVFGLVMVIATLQANAAADVVHVDNSLTLWVLAVATAGVIRSVAHRGAGTRILYDPAASPLTGIRRYIIVAGAQTVVTVAFFVVKLHAPGALIGMLTILLVAWPMTLAVVIVLPRFAALDRALPLADDKGFEGAAILMMILGMVGFGSGLIMLGSLLQASSVFLAQLPGIILLMTMLLLLVRSTLHVIAGWRGVHDTHIDRAAEAVSRYSNFAVITAFVADAGLVIMMMASGADAAGLLIICLVGYLLLAWPLIIRKFFGERQFADMLTGGESPRRRRATDLGHTTLGWFLVALGVLAISVSLPQALLVKGRLAVGTDWLGGGSPIGNPMTMLIAILQTAGPRSAWWAVGGAALQIWAGIELIRMSQNHRVVASIYGFVAAGVAIYVNLPLLDALSQFGMAGMLAGGRSGSLMFVSATLGLVVPIATVILVNRRTTVPATAAR